MARRSSSSSSSSCRQYLHSAYYIRRLMRLAFVFVIFILPNSGKNDCMIIGVVVMRVEVSSGTNDKLINEFDLVLNQRREKEAVTSNDAVRTCEAKMGAASTSALHGSRVGRGLQLAPVGGPRPPPPRWRRASGRLQRSRYGGSSAHP
ncbi:hypothetical protein MUK42_08073 [Musa troglodytarum]|uniref:Uncharacterized protein n=1 Tax=Musa troglodytarum TaxID=320322 RepID=A0A9E7HNG1_9LILI|nr:hypothetical protein MUK42_08073 [Musa troglodytarum]